MILIRRRCRCGAEFCYICGVRWKECTCATADLHRIEERAEEIVDRDAPNLLPQERRQRVDRVFAELQDRHECEHSRRFERVFYGAPRRGFRCEMCDARHHKYILRCQCLRRLSSQPHLIMGLTRRRPFLSDVTSLSTLTFPLLRC